MEFFNTPSLFASTDASKESIVPSFCQRLQWLQYFPSFDELYRRINKSFAILATTICRCFARIPLAPDAGLCHFPS